MHKKIQELAAGKCDADCPILRFSQEKLEIEVLEGKNQQGEFFIESTNEVPARGIIYSSNPRMECQNPQFQGTKITISYEFHSEGMTEGDVQKGSFYIICNEGEYDLPFCVSVSKGYPDSSQGRITSIFGFANLARKSYEEAAEVFWKPEFVHIFKPREEQERLVYESLKKRPGSMAQVEEFLIAAKKKERIRFVVEEARTEFFEIKEDERQQITLKKDNWGYGTIEMRSDAGFLTPERNFLTTQEFVGNRLLAEYVIVEKELHAGKNFGRITFENQFQKETVEICVTRRKQSDAGTRRKRFLEIQRRRQKLAGYYIEFRLQRMVTGAWAKHTCEELDFLSNLESENLWYPLYKAQVLLANRQRQDAEWILKSFRREARADKETPLYGYYLYLSTLYEPEPSYVNKLTGEIREIYRKNREHPVLLWILMFLDEEVNYSRNRKLEAVEQQVAEGCDDTLMYSEAYFLYRQEPYLLYKADSFERKILNWTVKHDGLTKEMAEQVRTLIPKVGGFDFLWYRIMEKCYEKFPSPELLQEICSYCVKCSCHGRRYMKWYALGVKEELRIGGLYEAWMMSADKHHMQKFPKLVTLYFQYQSSLAYRQQAMLYRAVIENKSSMKLVYQNYYQDMETFALNQLREGKIDSSLAVIYREVLTPGMLTPESAEWLAKVLFSHRIKCRNGKAVRVVVRQQQLCQEQAVPLVNHAAYVDIYGGNYTVLLEDVRGNRYLPETDISVKPLMEQEQQEFLKKGLEYSGGSLPYLLNYFDRKRIWQTYEEEDLPYLTSLLESELVSREYQEEIRRQMIAYYYDNYTGETLDSFLESLSFEGLERQIQGKLMGLLVARGHYEKAYRMILSYGSEALSPGKLVSILCNKIEEVSEEPDELLIGMCRTVFLRGKYNDFILKYMCQYFSGSLSEMTKLWETAREFELDTSELEERCLTQFLYTGSFAGYTEDIFENYDKKGGRELVILAYLSQMCHKYLLCDMPVSDYVFQRISARMAEGEKLNEVCRLGFLKWCSNQQKLTQKQKEQAEEILAEAVGSGKYFAFYRNLPAEFAAKYLYYDKTFLEYRTSPGKRVIISYGMWNTLGYKECEMTRMYSGIFVKPFLSFFGEEIPYYIKEEQDGELVVTQSGHIQSSDLCTCAEGSRYDLINDMVVSWKMKDESTLEKRMQQYEQTEQFVKEKFTVL